jgi:hypothetical protein
MQSNRIDGSPIFTILSGIVNTNRLVAALYVTFDIVIPGGKEVTSAGKLKNIIW